MKTVKEQNEELEEVVEKTKKVIEETEEDLEPWFKNNDDEEE